MPAPTPPSVAPLPNAPSSLAPSRSEWPLGAPPRLHRLLNFRDLGGLPTVDGRRMRAGLLFRSDAPTRLAADDLTTLRGLGLRTLLDLRSPAESRRRPPRLPSPETRLVNVSLHDPDVYDRSGRQLLGFLRGATGEERFRGFMRAYYRHLAFERTAAIGELMTALAEDAALPALIHCSAGKDRTGLVAALLQWLVGVPFEHTLADYLRTNEQYASRLRLVVGVLRVLTLFQVTSTRLRLVLMAQPEALVDVHDEILRRHGTVEAYLRDACAIAPTTLRTLQQRLVE